MWYSDGLLHKFSITCKIRIHRRKLHWEQEQGNREQVTAIGIVTEYGLDDEGSEFEP
jgi:hypothetical protein